MKTKGKAVATHIVLRISHLSRYSLGPGRKAGMKGRVNIIVGGKEATHFHSIYLNPFHSEAIFLDKRAEKMSENKLKTPSYW